MSTNFPGLENNNESALKPSKIMGEKRKTLGHS